MLQRRTIPAGGKFSVSIAPGSQLVIRNNSESRATIRPIEGRLRVCDWLIQDSSSIGIDPNDFFLMDARLLQKVEILFSGVADTELEISIKTPADYCDPLPHADGEDEQDD